jgi:hypothetical protein
MPDFGIMRGFNEKLFGDKLVAGQLPTQLGLIGSRNTFEGLLDIYPNAAVAYSLRQLTAAYTGSAIRVRRTDLTEANIGFTSSGDLDTTALLAFTGTGALDNGFVTTWYDQSGNGKNATQTTAINQPQIVSSGSVILQNGKPTIVFDGSNDFLVNTTAFTYTDFSAFLVNKWNAVSITANAMVQYSKLDLAFVSSNTFQSSDTGIATIASYPFSDVGITTRRLHTHLSTISAGTTTSTLFLNNTQKATASRALLATKTTLAISATDLGTIPANINQQEIILYASSQSSNRTGINTNINSYYGIY